VAAILISVSPNLEYLAITQPLHSRIAIHVGGSPGSLHYDYPLDRLLHRANADPGNISYLRNLRRVYFIVDETCIFQYDQYYIHIEFLDRTRLVDNLPSIESVGTDALCENDYDGTRLEPGSSKISRTHLNHCALKAPYLAYFTFSCKKLREFQYTVGRRKMLGGQFVPFNPKISRKSIFPHKDALEFLYIDAERHMYYFNHWKIDEDVEWKIDGRDPDFENDYYYPERQSFIKSMWEIKGSMRDFRALRRLSIGIGLLLYFATGVGENCEAKEEFMLPDGLPENLEYLCIRGYEPGHSQTKDKHMDALLAYSESGSSKLKEIVGIDE